MFLVTKSFYAKLLAVLRVSTNKGGNTPGVDNAVWTSGEEKLEAAGKLRSRGYRSKPLRRIYIPKKNGKKRPLSIPVMDDRAMQTLHKKPLTQWPNRWPTGTLTGSGHAARATMRWQPVSRYFAEKFLLNGFSRRTSIRQLADDNIGHDWILENIPVNKTILRQWLKAGFIEKKRLFPTDKGTPQGGTISPLIMNMVLDGLETQITKKFPRWKGKIRQLADIRYADDFVITAISKEVIANEIVPLVTGFLAERGLELSPEKSKITHIDDGFDFLSQNVRKFKGKLIIRPSKEAVQSFKDKIKKIIDENRGIPAHALIRLLNPVIRGWSNYHKGICSKRIFNRLATFIWWQLRRWAKYQHGNKNRWWIYHRYFHDMHFTDQRISKKGTENHRLYRIGYVPIRYHVKVKAEANPFLPEFDTYFGNRIKRRQDLAKECKQITMFMSNKNSNNSRVVLRRPDVHRD